MVGGWCCDAQGFVGFGCWCWVGLLLHLERVVCWGEELGYFGLFCVDGVRCCVILVVVGVLYLCVWLVCGQCCVWCVG